MCEHLRDCRECAQRLLQPTFPSELMGLAGLVIHGPWALWGKECVLLEFGDRGEEDRQVEVRRHKGLGLPPLFSP